MMMFGSLHIALEAAPIFHRNW
uniref:Uncharacterized protein n=1 Tax=Anguilla anguilla TaxID=7936 RepID=A0A0E9SV90_ANGAN